jgi:hypothetical protein
MKRFVTALSILLVSCKPAKVNVPTAEEAVVEQSADVEVETAVEEEAPAEEAAEEVLAGSSSADLLNSMKALDGVSLDLPCKDYVATKFDCTTVADINKSIIVGGEPAKVYEVEIRVRGAVEPMTYSGGSTDGSYFYVGGTASDKNFNIYSISTENPKQVYYLNSKATVGGYIDPIDYKVKIKVAGSSTVKLFASAQNGTIISNNKPVTIPGVTKAADVGQGQFVQLNVLSVQEVKAAALKLGK